MPPACQPYKFLWSPLNVSTVVGWGVGPQVNKFELVSSDDHQMSVVREYVPCLVGGGGGKSHVECIMDNGHMKIPMDIMTDGQKPVKTLPSRNFITSQYSAIFRFAWLYYVFRLGTFRFTPKRNSVFGGWLKCNSVLPPPPPKNRIQFWVKQNFMTPKFLSALHHRGIFPRKTN